MPIYEYTCKACGHALEAIQKFSDPVLLECPVCGKPELKKQISASGFQLKGDGWYASDSKTAKRSSADAASDSPTPADPAPAKKTAACGGGCSCH